MFPESPEPCLHTKTQYNGANPQKFILDVLYNPTFLPVTEVYVLMEREQAEFEESNRCSTAAALFG